MFTAKQAKRISTTFEIDNCQLSVIFKMPCLALDASTKMGAPLLHFQSVIR